MSPKTPSSALTTATAEAAADGGVGDGSADGDVGDSSADTRDESDVVESDLSLPGLRTSLEVDKSKRKSGQKHHTVGSVNPNI